MSSVSDPIACKTKFTDACLSVGLHWLAGSVVPFGALVAAVKLSGCSHIDAYDAAGETACAVGPYMLGVLTFLVVSQVVIFLYSVAW